jgi:hypothetical protein
VVNIPGKDAGSPENGLKKDLEKYAFGGFSTYSFFLLKRVAKKNATPIPRKTPDKPSIKSLLNRGLIFNNCISSASAINMPENKIHFLLVIFQS